MTPIYHITHVDNLLGILTEDGLWCDNERNARLPSTIGIAHQHIKDRRARKQVKKAMKGTLADYVPFHFAPRSPMLYAIHMGNVAGYNGTQQNVVHLSSSVEMVQQHAMPFCFTDGHAEMALSEQYEDIANLDVLIDWEIMKATYWNDTNEDGDRTRRRQAEFLVHRFFPWFLITEIGVINQHIAKQVANILRTADHIPNIVVHWEWYY